MKCSHNFTPGRLEFEFKKEKEDMERISSLKFSMTDSKIFFNLPVEMEDIHPDILAAATILLCNPFVGEVLHLPLPVSRSFFEMASKVISRYKIEERIDEDLESISGRENGIPGLAFSGGADSAAALAIMPARTIPVFLSRPIKKDSLYDSRAPLEICRLLAESGYRTQIIDSNLEFIRDPVGFPTDLANAIPAILVSDFLELDSIAFGTVLESGYGIGHEMFIDYGNGSHWRFFNTIFQSIGVDLCLPTLGISEVGTAIIGNTSPIASLGQSCIRGSWRNPCRKCWKCFRKELLSHVLKPEDNPEFWKMLSINEVQIRLSSFPISHENIITYSLQRVDLENLASLQPIAAKLDMSCDLSFLERWYAKSIEFVPDKYRNYIRSKILDYLEPTSFEDDASIQLWDMTQHLSSSRAKRGQDELIEYWQDLS